MSAETAELGAAVNPAVNARLAVNRGGGRALHRVEVCYRVNQQLGPSLRMS
jgi:hypothetical protein